jgi:ABC-2 type transport system permease protein
VMLISMLSVTSILGYDAAFPNPADRMAFATALGANPALSLVFGPARDLMSTDGFNAWRAGQLGTFFAGLMGVLIVVRNSKANEDSGQAELIASGVVARGTRLAVALLVATIAALALGVVCWGLTVAVGGGREATYVLALSFSSSALVFGAVAAVACQIGSDARAATSLSVAVIGVLYVLRGYVDSSGGADWLTWLTPFGWFERSGPATDNDVRPLLLAVVVAVVLVAVAFWMQVRRDFGQGLVATNAGPEAGGFSATIPGLAVRLHRGPLIGWIVALGLLGGIEGTLASSVGDVIRENPVMAQVLAAGILDLDLIVFRFLVTILQLIGIIAAVMGVQIVLRVHAEELDHRVAPLLAGSLRRVTYYASNVGLALLATAVAMLVAGLSLGLVASSRVSTVALGDVVRQALATVPAVWALVAVAVAAIGALPRIRMVAWLAVVAVFGITLLGPTFKLSEAQLGVRPFHHVPVVTASPGWTGLLAVGGVTVLLLLVGFVGFRRRDVG